MMKQKFTFKKLSILCMLVLVTSFSNGQVAQLTEGFDVINSNSTTPVTGWTATNRSSPLGTTRWYQGDVSPTTFSSFSGAGYISANYTCGDGTATLSNWLISPLLTLQNGSVIKFYTRIRPVYQYPDRLQVRLSINGASVNVGTTATSVGDFTTLLLDINPTYTSNGYPTVWTLYTITIAGLTGSTSGRVAFRYFVEDGGISGSRSDLIGIDQFSLAAPVVPVSLFDFLGSTDDKNNATLNWKTATEINSAAFVIERSVDGNNFTEVGKVNAKGNSTTTSTYQFSDHQLALVKTPTVYYRLKMLDADGSYTYSSIVTLKLKKPNQLLLVNATSNGSNITIQYTAANKEKTTIAIVNSMGVQVANTVVLPNNGLNTYTLNKHLTAGLYFIHITNGTEKVVGKLMK